MMATVRMLLLVLATKMTKMTTMMSEIFVLATPTFASSANWAETAARDECRSPPPAGLKRQ